jgi:O-antigen ligase
MEHIFVGHGPGLDFAWEKGLNPYRLPHSIFLFLLTITGLSGLLAFLFFLYRLLKMSIMSMGASLVSSPFPQALMKVLHVCLIMFIVDEIKIEYLRSLTYIYFVWLLFGLIAATQNIIQQNAKGQMLSAPSP